MVGPHGLVQIGRASGSRITSEQRDCELLLLCLRSASTTGEDCGGPDEAASDSLPPPHPAIASDSPELLL